MTESEFLRQLPNLRQAGFAQCRARGLSPDDCEDVVSIVTIRVWKKLPTIETEPKAYFHRAVQHMIYDLVRLKARKPEVSYDRFEEDYGTPLDLITPDPNLPAPCDRMICDGIMSHLSEIPHADLFPLLADGLSLDDIAELRGVPVGTVKTRIHRARKRIFAAEQ